MLTGKGMYIWKIKNVEGGDGKAASIAALNAGLTHVLIKVLDGPWAYNQRPVYDSLGNLKGYEDDILKPFIRPFRDKGIRVWGWQYVYHLHPVQEAEAANSRVANLNLDGFIIDAETEVKHRLESELQWDGGAISLLTLGCRGGDAPHWRFPARKSLYQHHIRDKHPVVMIPRPRADRRYIATCRTGKPLRWSRRALLFGAQICLLADRR